MTSPPPEPAEWFCRTIIVEIDRPLGSRHPEHDHLHPVDYGFVPGTMAGDDEPVVAYVLGVDVPVETFTGVVVAGIAATEIVDPAQPAALLRAEGADAVSGGDVVPVVLRC